MGIVDDIENLDLKVGGIAVGDNEAKDCISGSIPDGTWVIRCVGIGDSKGVSGSGKKDKRAIVLYAKDKNSDATPALIKQSILARWIPEFTRKADAEAAVANGTLWEVTLETSKEEIEIGEYKFKPQNATNVKSLLL